jgi:hypothetical protein
MNRGKSLLIPTSNPVPVPVRPVLHLAGSNLVWLCIAASAIPVARADQCEYFDEKTANMVQSEIKTGDILLIYCEPCDMPEPFPLRVRTVQVEKESGYPKPTNIDGVWYSYEDIKLGKVPGMTREEQKFVLESMKMANQGQYRLVINGEGRDLAYLYSQTGTDTYQNIGVTARCAEGVTATLHYKFPDKDQALGKPELPHYEDITGYCFDDSCLLKEWKTRSDVIMLEDHHMDARPVLTLDPGQTLKVLHILSEPRPVHAVVVFDQGRFLEGDEFYILNSLGEGYYRVWYYGRIVEEEISGVSMPQIEGGEPAKCVTPDVNCWAEADGQPGEVWWAEVQTSDGKQGWVHEPATVMENIFELY